MKQAGDIARQYAPRQSSESAPQMQRLSALWVRMTEMYTTRWTSQHGDTPTDTWCKGLADMSAADLGVGLAALLKSGEAWPPSLPEFRAYCRPPKRENAEAYRYTGPSLPHLLDDERRAKGRAAIAAIRGKLA